MLEHQLQNNDIQQPNAKLSITTSQYSETKSVLLIFTQFFPNFTITIQDKGYEREWKLMPKSQFSSEILQTEFYPSQLFTMQVFGASVQQKDNIIHFLHAISTHYHASPFSQVEDSSN